MFKLHPSESIHVETLKAYLRRTRKKLFDEIDPLDAVGGDPLRPLEDLGEFIDPEDCEALVMKPTLMCRLFGCKRAVPHYWDKAPCSCGKPIATVGVHLIVHQGCCRRCGQPIIPRARALKGHVP